jgi:hypothetical protein
LSLLPLLSPLPLPSLLMLMSLSLLLLPPLPQFLH